jgi:hypothetical protein
VKNEGLMADVEHVVSVWVGACRCGGVRVVVVHPQLQLHLACAPRRAAAGCVSVACVLMDGFRSCAFFVRLGVRASRAPVPSSMRYRICVAVSFTLMILPTSVSCARRAARGVRVRRGSAKRRERGKHERGFGRRCLRVRRDSAKASSAAVCGARSAARAVALQRPRCSCVLAASGSQRVRTALATRRNAVVPSVWRERSRRAFTGRARCPARRPTS